MITTPALRHAATLRREGSGLPRLDWSCREVEDQGVPDFVCELCGFAPIRFVHILVNPDWPGELRVGVICAGHLEGDFAVARERERHAKNTAARRVRALDRYHNARRLWPSSPEWRRSDKGNRWTTARRVRVCVLPNLNRPGWEVIVGDRLGRRTFTSADEATLAIFDDLWPLETFLDDFDRNGKSTIKLPGDPGFR